MARPKNCVILVTPPDDWKPTHFHEVPTEICSAVFYARRISIREAFTLAVHYNKTHQHPRGVHPGGSLQQDAPALHRQLRRSMGDGHRGVASAQPAVDERGCDMISQPKPPVYLDEFFEQSYRPLKLLGKSQSGVRLHQTSQRNFWKFVGHRPTLEDLTDENVVRFMAWHLSKGNSRYTANNERNRLLALWRFACRKGLLTIWPDVPLLPEPERAPEAWALEEVERLLAACLSMVGMIDDGLPANRWWFALHLVLFDTGERIGAVRSLRWCDLDLQSGWIVCRAETRKCGREDKTFRLKPDTVEALEAIRKPQRELIFPWSRCDVTLYNHYCKLLRKAGLPADRKSKFHRMRKTVASHFKARGGDATELLGHRDSRTTRRYFDPRIVLAQQAADVLPGIRPSHEADSSTLPLADLLSDFFQSQPRSSEKFARTRRYRVEQSLTRCKFITVSDLDFPRFLAACEEWIAAGMTRTTAYQYVAAMCAFTRWLVEKRGIVGPVVDFVTELRAVYIACCRNGSAYPTDERKDGAA